MPSSRKSPRTAKKKRSRASILNYVLGAFVALSMVLSSVVVFSGTPAQPTPTPPIATVTAAPTAVETATITPAASATIAGSATAPATLSATGTATP